MKRAAPEPQSWSRLSWWLLSVPILVKVLGIALLVASIFGSILLYWTTATLSQTLYLFLEQRARSSAAWLAASLERPLVTGDLLTVRQELARTLALTPDLRYAIVWDPSGRAVAHTFQTAVPLDLERLAPQGSPRRPEVRVLESREGLILDARCPILKGNAGVLELGLTDRQVAQGVSTLTGSVLLALGTSIVLSSALALLLTRLLIQPVQDLVQTAHRIERGDFEVRAEVYAEDEVGRLAIALNQMAEALRTYRREVEEKEKARLFLLDQIVQAQEEERKNISRELHDQLGQSLAALLLTVQSNAALRAAPADVQEDVTGQIRRLSDEVRRLAWGMRPSILDDYGLDSALARYVQEMAKASGLVLDYQYTSPPGVGRLAPRIEVTLYRIAQEAVTNVVCHAQAARASVVVLRQSHEVTLLVDDDGRGFTPAQVPGDRSLGLTGMRERASLLGGTCLVESRPGEGTTIRVNIPLHRNEPCPSVS